jgi:hypothetical protein
VNDLTFLREAVAVMRELGVLSWNGIVLGPPSVSASAPLTEEEKLERMKQAIVDKARRVHETMFAAVSVRPRPEDVVPRGVTASERDDGRA